MLQHVFDSTKRLGGDNQQQARFGRLCFFQQEFCGGQMPKAHAVSIRSMRTLLSPGCKLLLPSIACQFLRRRQAVSQSSSALHEADG
jgi:hypothetical protein